MLWNRLRPNEKPYAFLYIALWGTHFVCELYNILLILFC